MSQYVQPIDFSVNLLRALLWQHNEAVRLEAILQAKQNWYQTNQTDFWTNWIRDIFDLRTASEFGCQVWAKILGLKLQLNSNPSAPTKPTFGFGTFNRNFTHGNFSQTSSGTISIPVEIQRLILRLRYFQLISRCTVPETNRFMAAAFQSYGHVYVLDHNDMSYNVTFVFGFALGSQLSYALTQYDVLPRPSTVGVEYIVATRPVFGFGTFNKNFTHGNFPSHSL